MYLDIAKVIYLKATSLIAPACRTKSAYFVDILGHIFVAIIEK